MATNRPRGNRYEFTIRRKGLLPRPVYLSFDTKEEGIAYCARLERLLDSGIVPEELKDKAAPLTTISLAYEVYQRNVNISAADESYFPVILKRWGSAKIVSVDYAWTEHQIDRLKTEWHLSPSTIRHQVGALSRLWDWLVKRQAVATNPFKALKRGYASGDKKDVSRDRRPTLDELEALQGHLHGDMKLLMLLALETAMRMREMYSLMTDQIDVSKRTIFLDKSKNGDRRQVPLSSVAVHLLGKFTEREQRVFAELWNGSYDKSELRAATSKISVRWGRACKDLGIKDLHFHDLRHEAICRLYERTKLSDLQISLISGHKNLEMLRRYSNLRGSHLALSLW